MRISDWSSDVCSSDLEQFMNGLAPALPLPLATGHEATLEGKVKKIVYDSPDGRMRVFEVELDDKTIETVRQFDNIHPINKNDQIRIFGKVVLHKRWGRQFQARDVLRSEEHTSELQ